MIALYLLGALAALFAAALLVLPTLRVARGRLEPRKAAGLWISGVGFLLLALAALVFRDDAARAALFAGVAVAVVGNIVQRRVG